LIGNKWQDGFDEHWRGDQNQSVREEFRAFKRQVLENFKYYRVPVISLDRSTSKESRVRCLRKGKHGGKALDAFELVTAMYAASGHELRKDWYGDDGTKGRHRRLAETLRPAGEDTGIIAGVGNTEFSFRRFRFFIHVTGDARQKLVGSRARNCRRFPATSRHS